jgi:hypothetical protein
MMKKKLGLKYCTYYVLWIRKYPDPRIKILNYGSESESGSNFQEAN